MGSKERRMHARKTTHFPSRHVTTASWAYGPYQGSVGSIINRAGTRR